MSLPGVKSNNVTNRVPLSDELVVNRDGSTGLQLTGDLALQLAATGPIASAIAAAAGKWISHASQTEMNADLAWPDGQEARVYNDPGKGVYRKNGASGSGSWSYIGPIPEGDTTELQALVDDEIEQRSSLVGQTADDVALHMFRDQHGNVATWIDLQGRLRWQDLWIRDSKHLFELRDRDGAVAAYVDDRGNWISRASLAPSIKPELADDASPLLPSVLVGMEGWDNRLYLKQAMPIRKDEDWFEATLFRAGTPDGVQPSRHVRTTDELRIDLDHFAGNNTLSIRRYGIANIRKDRSLQVIKAPASAPVGAIPLTVMTFGDSTANRGKDDLIKRKLTALGYDVTFVGSMIGAAYGEGASATGGQPGEGREGWETPDFTFGANDRVTTVAVGGEAAYWAQSKTAKTNVNPYLRDATGGDDPTLVCHGKVFDLAWGVSRLGLTMPNAFIVHTGANDVRDRPIEQVENYYVTALTIIGRQCRAASASAGIFVNVAPPQRKLDRDDLWSERYTALLRGLMRVQATLADPKFIVMPTWATVSAEEDWSANTSVIDPDTGVATRRQSDGIHYGPSGQHQVAETQAAYLAAFAAGLI